MNDKVTMLFPPYGKSHWAIDAQKNLEKLIAALSPWLPHKHMTELKSWRMADVSR